MDRITIYSDEYDEYGNRPRLGWFDLDAAQHILTEDDSWNGNNMIGNVSGLQLGRARLYRTAGGRWVDHTDASREFNGPNSWTFLTDDEAREWMVKSGGDKAEAALKEWFPETPDEIGPDPKGGRPAVGPTINVAFPRELLDRIDNAAQKSGLTRAAWLRQVAAAAVGDAEARGPVDL